MNPCCRLFAGNICSISFFMGCPGLLRLHAIQQRLADAYGAEVAWGITLAGLCKLVHAMLYDPDEMYLQAVPQLASRGRAHPGAHVENQPAFADHAVDVHHKVLQVARMDIAPTVFRNDLPIAFLFVELPEVVEADRRQVVEGERNAVHGRESAKAE